MEEKKKLTKTLIKTNPINIKKERNPGVDLLRIIGMIDIIIFHILMKLESRFMRYKDNIFFMMVFTQWHISNFGIISGIVGYKTNKYSNLMYLYICVLFYSLVIHYIYKKYFPQKLMSTEAKEYYYFPFIFYHYWYFTTYFKMYLFLPLINKGLSLIDKYELRIIIASLFGILFIWKDLKCKERDRFCSDTSAKTLLVYYLIGAYIGKYVINKKEKIIKKINIKMRIINIIKNIAFYLILIIIIISSNYITYYSNFYYGNSKFRLMIKKIFYNTSNSFAMVLNSICLFLIFTRIKYNKYISKIISFFGPLAFSAYLIHNHNDVRSTNLIADSFNKYNSDISLIQLEILIILNGIKIFFICVVIDYIRFLIFKILKIRTICIYIEKLISFLFKIIK